MARNQPYSTQVLIIGGGTGGVAAGIQSARMGVQTLIVEPTDWLGGMLTSAGVSATDGNHRMPAGLWGEFRSHIWKYYGGPDSVATGWVSNTQFEPHVGARIFLEMAHAEDALGLWFRSKLISLKRSGSGWVARVKKEGKTFRVQADVLVDGTDLGDVAALAGARYDLGMDSRESSGEPMAPEIKNDIVQDLTMVAILKDFGPGADKTIPRPAGYDPEDFRCSCREFCPGDTSIIKCESMLSYARLPRDKYMLNWPGAGNDYYANVVEKGEKARRSAYDSARLQTLRYVYFIQTELGYRNLGLANDEFPTEDKLAFYPYHREGRRVRGLVRVTLDHISDPYRHNKYRTGAVVGDYPIDHHHKKNPESPTLVFPKVPSFNIPLGALIPKDVDKLVMADKAISVSNIVNGSSRLQPVVMQIGQAAGAIAAMAVLEQTSPGNLSVRALQETLLEAGAYLLPFFDIQANDPHFAAIHRIGATGILRGRGEPYLWANRTWFDPDSNITWASLAIGLRDLPGQLKVDSSKPGASLITIQDALGLCTELLKQTGENTPAGALGREAAQNWTAWGLTGYQPERPLSRRELAKILDVLVDPFHRWELDWEGNWK